MRKVATVLVAATMVLALSACGDDDDTGVAAGEDDGAGVDTQVTAVDFSFDPPSLTLAPGEETTLTFTNEGETAHTFTIDDLDVDEEAKPGESVEVTIDVPETGGASFYCRFHESQMTGVVNDAAAAGGGTDTTKDGEATDLDGY